MRFQTWVALTDFSPEADRALERAAQLAATHGGRLQLLCAVARDDARFADAQATLAQRARQLARRHWVDVQALPWGGHDVLAALLQAAAGADVLVVAQQSLQARPAWWRSNKLAPLLQRAPCPVLWVRQSSVQDYAQVLVALDGTQAEPALLHCAGAVQPQARVELFHAQQPRDPCAQVQDFRQGQAGRVHLTDALQARRNRVAWNVGAGRDKVRQIAVQQERSSADLVVVGHRPQALQPWWGGGLRLTRLLQAVHTDMLLVPLPAVGTQGARIQRTAPPTGQLSRA